MRIATLDLSLRRRSIIGYAAGMAAYVVVVVALYPAFKDSTSLDQLTKDSPGVAALFGISGSLTSPTGWLNANIYANFFPLLILLMTIGYGAWCIAGQERDGHLELVMGLPFSRNRVLGQKVVALVAQAMFLSAVVFVSCLVGRAFELCSASTSAWSPSRSARPPVNAVRRSRSRRPSRQGRIS
jgi:ABC-2 type transport system permease protein